MDKETKITIEKLLATVKTYNQNAEDLELIQKAYDYAYQHHLGEKRKTGEDFIEHPLQVAYILTDIKADTETICASLLHDVYGDAKQTEEELGSVFSKEIVSLVTGLQSINRLSFDMTSNDKIRLQRKIFVGLCEDVRIIIMKLASRLHNMRTLWAMPLEKQKMVALETQEILIPIVNRLGMSKMKGELEDLCLRYLKPEAYFSIVEQLNRSKEERDREVKNMMDHVSELLHEAKITHEIKGRSKSVYGIYKKLDKGKKFSDIYDILALRIYVNTEEECYRVLGIVHAKYKPLPKRFKDYIAMPKTNLYQSLHTTVFGEDGLLYEIQIRTYEMDEIAERGIASHWAYKENNANDVSKLMKNVMEQKLQFYRSLIELQKEEITEEEFVNSVKNDCFKENVYVFTPNGDVVELPIGSTPIDFAYRVHSAIGDKMVGAIVNNNIVPLNYELKDNDIVKINTNKSSTGPNYEWLLIAKTSQAKNKIRAFLNKVDKETYLKRGEDLLKEELRRKKISITEFFKEENSKELLSFLKIDSVEELYIAIGSNKITLASIINFVLNGNTPQQELILKKTQNHTIATPSVKTDILVSGADEIKVNVALCCKPIPGDEIIGYITKGAGIRVHRKDCPNVKEIEERTIAVHWNTETQNKYPCSLWIQAAKKEDILLSILKVASNNGISVQNMQTIPKTDYNLLDLTVLTTNKEKITKFENEICSLPDIYAVQRGMK
jgi:GTP pyrophosphokinase